MTNNNFAILQRQEATFINCIDSLAPANVLDRNNEDVNIVLHEALQDISYYPKIMELKRAVLKNLSLPDKNAVEVEAILNRCIKGEAEKADLQKLKELLGAALEFVQRQISQLDEFVRRLK